MPKKGEHLPGPWTPPYDHGYIKERHPPATLDEMREDAARRRRDLNSNKVRACQIVTRFRKKLW